MSARIAHVISFLFALGIVAVVAMFNATPLHACGALPAKYAPVLAFELARSLGDVQAIFGGGPSPCREAAVAAFTKINFTDNFYFIPVYSLFTVFFFLGIRKREPLLAYAGMALAVIAALADWVENHNLALIAASPDMPSQALPALHYATSVKWMALGTAGFVGGLILGQSGGWLNNIAFALCALGLVLTGLGLVYSPTFGPSISNAILISWLIFLIGDVREMFRRAPA